MQAKKLSAEELLRAVIDKPDDLDASVALLARLVSQEQHIAALERERDAAQDELIEDRQWSDKIGGHFFELERHAGAYFDGYCVDEAEDVTVCVDPRQHESAIRFQAALRAARDLIEGRARLSPAPAPTGTEKRYGTNPLMEEVERERERNAERAAKLRKDDGKDTQ